MSNNYIEGNVLVSGDFSKTGYALDISGSQINTLYYNYIGQNPGGMATLGVEARDAGGNWGYVLDVRSFLGAGSQTALATFNNPVNNGIRGFIDSISNANAQILIDSLYSFNDGLTMVYDNKQILAGQPIPLFSKVDNQIRFGERWSTQSVLTLHGILTGCTYNSIITAQQQVINAFSKDFQEFLIIENGKTLYSQNYNIIRDINFENSNYFGFLNYTVTLESQPRNLFSGYYGVTNPVNQWSFQENDNKLLEITHTISARGINTSNSYSNSFDNAKNYVLGLTGLNSFVQPFFAEYCTGMSLCLDTFSESINRFDNEYSVTEKYIPGDLIYGGAGYIRFTTDFSCNSLSNFSSLSINGEVKSCKNADLTTLRSKYQNFDVLGAAITAYSGATNGRLDINPNYLTSGITEDIYTKKIGFNVSFDNNPLPATSFFYETQIKVDETDVTSVGIRGTIQSRGDAKLRWANVQDFYNTKLNLFNLANQAYTEFFNGNPVYPLNPQQDSYSVTKNQFDGTISVSTEFTNKDLFPPEFSFLDYTISFKPSIPKISAQPLVNLGNSSGPCNSFWYCQNLGFTNRTELSVQGRANAACTGTWASTVTGIKNLENSIFLTYGSPQRVFLDKNFLKQTNDNKGLNFDWSAGWSFDGRTDTLVNPFSYVNQLSLK